MEKGFFERAKLFFVVAGVILVVAGCSLSDTDDFQSCIDAVENTLIAAVIHIGSEPAGMSLSERMQHYQVPGGSIIDLPACRFDHWVQVLFWRL